MPISAQKFLLVGASILRRATPPPSLSNPYPSLRFLRCCASVAAEAVSLAGEGGRAPEAHHPWPEWVSFVDRLKSNGYLTAEVEAGRREDDGDGESLYRNRNLLQDPCLSFARDRYDVFKLLSRKDIEAVVQGGCPNLLRKAVNSAKRLRAYVRLDEGDVCSACNLRGSCDRAYVILKETEAAARTVDIVRILLFYALNPLVSGEEKPPGGELAEASARKLLSHLIQLSDMSPAPATPKPVDKPHDQKEKPMPFIDAELSQDVEMKRGDWMCPKCNFLNFSRNLNCRKCKEDGPKNVGADDIEMKKGDWICAECNFMNFSRNIRCLKCKAEGPKRIGGDDIEMKKGDWNCPECGFMNFASKRNCMRCREPRPKRQLNPGEWECPSCDFLNYRKNMKCLKCKCERPDEA